MPHISSKKIPDEHFNSIYKQLISICNTAGQKREADILFKELLTETEKMMLAKRLAIIYMLSEGVSEYYISETLFVSPSTVSRISLSYESGRCSYIQKIIKKNKETVWQAIEKIISYSVEMHTGKGRWKWFNEMQKKHN